MSAPTINRDRWKAAFYGQAIGDALGIPLEFKSAFHIQLKHPEGIDMRYHPTSRFGGEQCWKAGEFSDDTWQAIEILRAYCDTLDTVGEYDADMFASNMAQGLIRWLGADGRGCGAHTSKVMGHADFWIDPVSAAHNEWENGGRTAAPNGAAMRASVCGIIRPWDPEFTVSFAAQAARVTHADPKCVASAVAISSFIADMVAEPGSPRVLDALDNAAAIANQIHPDADRFIERLTLEEVALDEGMDNGGGKKAPIGFTYKALGAGFAAVRLAYVGKNKVPPMEALKAVLEAGGDTDTNAAVAGAMLGAVGGMSIFPEHLVTGLVQRPLIDDLLKRLAATYS